MSNLSRPNVLKDLVNVVPKIMIKVEKTESWVQKKYKLEYNPFTQIHNILSLIKELLIWFDESWSEEEKEGIFKPEYSMQKDKVITITRWGFIQTFSVIEYTIKEVIKQEKYVFFKECLKKWERGGNVSFFNLIKIFNDVCKINDEDYIKWNNLREIRNCLIHNNGITDKELIYELNGKKLVHTLNSMLHGDLDSFLILIEQMSKLYALLLWDLFTQEL